MRVSEVPEGDCLFYSDRFIDHAPLREITRTEVIYSAALVDRCSQGDLNAVRALKVAFWPFVAEFERAIDRRSLPRTPLSRKFGARAMRGTFLRASQPVREMKEEERSHALAWKRDAETLGMTDLDGYVTSPSVKLLIESTSTDSIPYFFSALAATEFVAEELSARLTRAPKFVDLFPSKTWSWGDSHVLPHTGPSHLDIDLDLARAYSSGDGDAVRAELETEMLRVIRLFGQAANEVHGMFATA